MSHMFSTFNFHELAEQKLAKGGCMELDKIIDNVAVINAGGVISATGVTGTYSGIGISGSSYYIPNATVVQCGAFFN